MGSSREGRGMSTESELHRLVRAAQDFYQVLERHCWHSPEWWAMSGNEVESPVYPAAVALTDALEAAPGPEDSRLPRRARRGLGELRRRFDGLIDRWGWRGVVGPG